MNTEHVYTIFCIIQSFKCALKDHKYKNNQKKKTKKKANTFRNSVDKKSMLCYRAHP